MAPPPRAFIDGTTARTIRSVLNSSRFAASCQAASSNDSAGPDGGPPRVREQQIDAAEPLDRRVGPALNVAPPT